MVNDAEVDIPSYQIRQGDQVKWGEKGQKTALFEIAKSNCKSIQSPHWINLDQDKMTASIVTEPGAEDGEIVIDTVQIVEYYSK